MNTEYMPDELPEGVVSGEDVPRENEEEQVDQSEISRLVKAMKDRPFYSDKPEDELREIARRKIK